MDTRAGLDGCTSPSLLSRLSLQSKAYGVPVHDFRRGSVVKNSQVQGADDWPSRVSLGVPLVAEDRAIGDGIGVVRKT